MKVLSWNILAHEWIKKSHYKGLDKKILFNRKKRFSTIKKHLLEEKADIILLQEVMPYEYKHLVKLLKETHYASPLLPISWNGVYGQSGNATFIGRNLLKSKNLECEVMHKNVNDFCLYTIVNKDFAIFNIHLDDLSHQTRLKQIKELSLYEKLHKNCVIGGDFNELFRINSKLYNFTTSNYKISNKECITYFNESAMNIDNILIKGKEYIINKTQSNYYENKTDFFKSYGSDHLPVIIIL